MTAIQQVLVDHCISAAEISVAVVDDPTIQDLNLRYLNHDFETDVISFVLDFDQTTMVLCGQLIVSADTAFRCANEMGGAMEDELLLYVVHGTLHLVGYDDKNQKDADEMREQERHYLSRHGVTHRWSDPMDGATLSNVLQKDDRPADDPSLVRGSDPNDPHSKEGAK